jgi:transposase
MDLAKHVIQLHGVDSQGHVVLRKRLSRAKVLPFLAPFPACLLGLEASGGAHYGARELTKVGHTVKLMRPQFVRPSMKDQQNDAHDAAGICEAVSRPPRRFVPITSVDQQDRQALHRMRERQITARTARVHQLRGLLAAYGLIIPQGMHKGRQALPALLEDPDNMLTWHGRAWLRSLAAAWRLLDHHVTETDQKMQQGGERDEACQRLAHLEGLGPLMATALVAAVGTATPLTNGRPLAAWLGLVPRQHASGGKPP